jgi:hypothetical protein
MKVYKYRSNYDRDIKLLSRSKIYTPCKNQLNDPFEGLIRPKIFEDYEVLRPYLLPSEYERKINLVRKLIVQIGYTGIYSLSKSWKNELLWVHYANSHRGFCIEYELDDLILDKSKTVIFPKILEIEYNKEPPQYTLEGMDDITEKQLLQKLLGTKSLSWKYEKEIRIIFKENGEQEINRMAIKSIIFGANATEKDINNTLRNIPYKIKYFKICLKDKYELFKNKIKIC